MESKFIRVFTLDAPIYTEGCPVIIVAGALLIDNQSGNVLAQIKFQNIEERVIRAISVSITALDTAGRVISEGITHEYLDLSVKRDETFGQKEAVFLPVNSRGFIVKVFECVLDDGSIWNSQSQTWSHIPKQNSIKFFLNNDDDLVEQYRLDICSKAEYEMVETDGIWLCACGAVNASSERNCHSCGTSVESFRNFDIDDLSKRKESRLSKSRAALDDTTNKTTKSRSVIAIVLGAVMLAAIVLCVVYPKIADSKPLDNTADIQNTAAVETDPALFTDYLHWINNDEELESGLKSFYDSTGIMPYLYLTGKTNGKRSVTEADIGDYTYNLYDELFTNDDGQVDENRILVVYLHYDDVYASSCVTGIQAESVLGDEGRKILLDDIGQYHLKYKDSSEWFAAAFRDAGETICKRLNIVNGSNGNPGEPQGENLGTLKLLEDLNIRTGPGTGYSTTGVLKKGNTAKYYEVKSADGYTWYRIGDNNWIADDGTWITTDSSYVNSGESQSESVDTLITLEDLNIRTGPGTGYNITGVLKKGSKANFYKAKNADGYFWYRISDNEWIADDGTWISIFGNGNVSVENVIDIAKQHATWINDYVASIGANHIGWDCRYVIEDEVYWNYATEVETFIPAGSFQGGYGVYSGSSGWSIYEFAYIKKGNGYEFLDLFRYDKDVSE